MKNHLSFLLILASIYSCTEKEIVNNPIVEENWEKRTIERPVNDSLIYGESYLSAYTQVYSKLESKTLGMTATVTLRNVNRLDTVYVNKISFHNSNGKILHEYINKTIFLAPLETIKIVVDESDFTNGSGSSFIFNWSIKKQSKEPLFESVMVSTYGKQGLSFSMQGVRTK